MCVALAWRRLLFWPFGADHTYVEHSAALSSALHPGKGSKNRIPTIYRGRLLYICLDESYLVRDLV